MRDTARTDLHILEGAQESVEKPAPALWERQKNEPAGWFLRFQIYKSLGPGRSLRKALQAELERAQATKGNAKKAKRADKSREGDHTLPPKKLSEVSIPSSWSRAARVWNWKERAHAYDLSEQERQAGALYVALEMNCFYASRPYRIMQLNGLAILLRDNLNRLAATGNCPIKILLQMTARLQAIMADIGREVSQLDSKIATALDATALEQLYKDKGRV